MYGMKELYIYYFRNLECALEDVKEFTKENKSRVYEVLYTFIAYLSEEYKKLRSNNKSVEKEVSRNFLMITSSVMNAVVSAGLQESEAFCEYAFISLIPKDLIYEQVMLFVMHQELLYRSSTENIDMNFLKKIPDLNPPFFKDSSNFYKFLVFWNLWIHERSISKQNGNLYFWNLMYALKGGKCGSTIGIYAESVLRRTRKENLLC